jgi:hypothetical protein
MRVHTYLIRQSKTKKNGLIERGSFFFARAAIISRVDNPVYEQTTDETDTFVANIFQGRRVSQSVLRVVENKRV